MAVGCCLVAILAVVGQLMVRNGKSAAPEPAAEIAVEAPDPRALEFEYLVDQAGPLTEEAEDLLNRYVSAGSAADVLPLIRNAGTIGPRLAGQWRPWGANPPFAKGVNIETLVTDDTVIPSLVSKGSKGDLGPFGFYFVRESGRLKIDWEASEGAGDLRLEELRAGVAAENGMVRVKVRPGNFYTPEFPDTSFRSYQLTDLSGDQFVWALAPLDSEVAAFLKSALNEGSHLLAPTTEYDVTLRLTGPKQKGANLFMITEILHKGWVSP